MPWPLRGQRFESAGGGAAPVSTVDTSVAGRYTHSMATESTRKHRPTIDDIRRIRSDAETVRRDRISAPGLDATLDTLRATYIGMALGWVLGENAPGIPEGLETVQAQAAALRKVAAPKTEAEVFEGLAQ